MVNSVNTAAATVPERVDKEHLYDGNLIPKNLVAPVQKILAELPDGR